MSKALPHGQKIEIDRAAEARRRIARPVQRKGQRARRGRDGLPHEQRSPLRHLSRDLGHLRRILFARLSRAEPEGTPEPRRPPRGRRRRSDRDRDRLDDSPNGRALTIPAIAEVQAQWFRTLEQLTDRASEPTLLDASAGSFVVRFETSGTHEEHTELRAALRTLRHVAELLDGSALQRGPTRRRKKLLESIRRALSLLATLAESNAVLEVTTQIGRGPAQSFDLRPPSPEQLEAWQNAAAGWLPSVDVPQADDLTRVLRFVDLVAVGTYPTPQTLNVVGRQVNDYRRAAEILGYLRDRRLSPSGRLLARFSGADRWTHVLEHVTTSDVGSAWIDWSDAANFLDVDPSTVASFLEQRVIGLSPSTILRRALTLSTWHETLTTKTRSPSR